MSRSEQGREGREGPPLFRQGTENSPFSDGGKPPLQPINFTYEKPSVRDNSGKPPSPFREATGSTPSDNRRQGTFEKITDSLGDSPKGGETPRITETSGEQRGETPRITETSGEQRGEMPRITETSGEQNGHRDNRGGDLPWEDTQPLPSRSAAVRMGNFLRAQGERRITRQEEKAVDEIANQRPFTKPDFDRLEADIGALTVEKARRDNHFFSKPTTKRILGASAVFTAGDGMATILEPKIAVAATIIVSLVAAGIATKNAWQKKPAVVGSHGSADWLNASTTVAFALGIDGATAGEITAAIARAAGVFGSASTMAEAAGGAVLLGAAGGKYLANGMRDKKEEKDLEELYRIKALTTQRRTAREQLLGTKEKPGDLILQKEALEGKVRTIQKKLEEDARQRAIGQSGLSAEVRGHLERQLIQTGTQSLQLEKRIEIMEDPAYQPRYEGYRLPSGKKNNKFTRLDTVYPKSNSDQ